MKAIHLICRRDTDGKFLGLRTIDAKSNTYESCCWVLSDQQAHELVGGWCYLHPESKNQTSEFGGVIRAFRHAKRDGAAIVEGVALTIVSRKEARGQKWRGADHVMAWTSGIIDGTFAHETDSGS